MVPQLEKHRAEIETLCRKFGVKRLEVFGSIARGTDFDEANSDADFLVKFGPFEPGNGFRQYFGFVEEMEKLLGRKVDLVEDGAVRNPYIKAEIERSKRLVFSA